MSPGFEETKPFRRFFLYPLNCRSCRSMGLVVATRVPTPNDVGELSQCGDHGINICSEKILLVAAT